MSTSNKRAGKLYHSDVNGTSVCSCQHVGKLCWGCCQLAVMAEGSTGPPEAPKAAAAPCAEQSSPCCSCAASLCVRGLGAACSWAGAAQGHVAFELAPVCCQWGLLTPILGGWMVCGTSVTVRPWGSRASNVPGLRFILVAPLIL